MWPINKPEFKKKKQKASEEAFVIPVHGTNLHRGHEEEWCTEQGNLCYS